MTTLPIDLDNNPIQALSLRNGGAHAMSVTSSSGRTASFAADTRVLSVYATGPVYIRFGGADVTAAATDHYFPAGVYYDFAIGGGKTGQKTHMAAIRADQDCAVYVSEKI